MEQHQYNEAISCFQKIAAKNIEAQKELERAITIRVLFYFTLSQLFYFILFLRLFFFITDYFSKTIFLKKRINTVHN